MGDRPSRVSARKRRFLKAFRLSANVSEGARTAGVVRQTVYRWCADDAEFKALMEVAEQDAIDAVEQVAHNLATGQYRRVVASGGKVVAMEDIYSERMIELILKARRPDRYKDRQSLEHSGEIRTIQSLLSDVPTDEV